MNFLSNSSLRMQESNFKCIHFNKVMTVNEDLSASSLSRSGALFSLLLCLSLFLFIPFLDLFSRQVIRVFLKRFLTLPGLFSFGGISNLGSKSVSKGHSLDLVIEVPEVFSGDPLLVVKGHKDLHWTTLLDVLKLVL